MCRPPVKHVIMDSPGSGTEGNLKFISDNFKMPGDNAKPMYTYYRYNVNGVYDAKNTFNIKWYSFN